MTIDGYIFKTVNFCLEQDCQVLMSFLIICSGCVAAASSVQGCKTRQSHFSCILLRLLPRKSIKTPNPFLPCLSQISFLFCCYTARTFFLKWKIGKKKPHRTQTWLGLVNMQMPLKNYEISYMIACGYGILSNWSKDLSNSCYWLLLVQNYKWNKLIAWRCSTMLSPPLADQTAIFQMKG